MISGAGRTLTYDYDNKPTSITYGSTYAISVYDAYGNRVKKITPNSTTTYIEQLYECTSGICTKYIFAGSQRIANIKGTETYYYHTDHLGSSSIITDKNATKVEDIFYYPYGEMKFHTGSINVGHKFTGQEYDAETGLYYYGARYYDPKLGRFISADTMVPEPFNPQALNRYSYVLNNPLRYIDPTGHGFFDFLDDVWDWIDETVDDAWDWLGENVNVNVYVSTPVVNYGNSSGGSPQINYTGPGSGSGGGGGSGGNNSLQYASDNGITLDMTFYLRYGDHQYNVDTIRDSINREMYPSRSTTGSTSSAARNEVDWVSATLAGTSSISSLVAIGAPHPYVKIGAGFIGTISTGGSVLYSIYQYKQGEMSRNELALQVALDITPMFGKGAARVISKKIYEAVGGGFDIIEHQIGTGEVIYETIIKPNRER
jgi:RHS repeat-associated protein